ncbi:MAG: tyrosinase family protein [Chloroflexota bacterium]
MTVEGRESLQQQVDSFLLNGSAVGREPAAESTRWSQPFTPFDVGEKKHILQQAIFDREVIEEPAALLSLSNRIAQAEGIAFAQEWLKAFLMHNATSMGLTIPPFLQRHPYLLRRSPHRTIESTEDRLNWFREDLFLSEHHEHWHALYGESLTAARLKDRQGELFLYMHQQMLARYNTERIAAELDAVIPFPENDFSEPIVEGYDPGLAGYFWPREAGAALADGPVVARSFLTEWLQKLRAFAANQLDTAPEIGHVENKEDVLGSLLTGNGRFPGIEDFGNIHGALHKRLGGMNGRSGVMQQPQVSANDPIFYRWHRCLDNIAFDYQQQQPPNDFASEAPAVLVRSRLQANELSQSPDIILAFAHQLERVHRKHETLADLGERLFGQSNWDEAFSQERETTTDTLFTCMKSVNLPLPNGDGETAVTFLDQTHEFVTFIRVQNELSQPQTVTARVWLVAKHDQHGQILSNNRRLWVELDTFQVRLGANERKVVCRPAWESSIIKKVGGIGLRPTTALSLLKPQAVRQKLGSEDYCDCGWPYNLLLPKGTPEGMTFRLMVMFTHDDVILPNQPATCGSIRLCGAKQSLYPDKKRMGYPFNRPFVDSIEETLGRLSNTAVRDIQIVFQP